MSHPVKVVKKTKLIPILVTGWREFKNRECVASAFDHLEKLYPCDNFVIYQGGCRGADTLAANEARRRTWECITYKANWEHFGKRAGPIRNRQMIKESKAKLLLVFHPDENGGSGGTGHCVKDFRKAHKHKTHRIRFYTGRKGMQKYLPKY